MAEFIGERLITIGVQNEIPAELQMLMWDSIDEYKRQGVPLDYLQIFILTMKYDNGSTVQEITHKQEQPHRKKNITIETDNPIYAKIFVIDDVDHVTMLLNNEY